MTASPNTDPVIDRCPQCAGAIQESNLCVYERHETWCNYRETHRPSIFWLALAIIAALTVVAWIIFGGVQL